MKVIAILRVQACINCQLISQDFRCWVTNLFWFRLDNLACCRVRCMFLLSGTGGGSGFTHRNPGEDRIRETEADPAVQPGGQWGHSEDRGPGNRGERQLQSYDFLTCHRLYMYLSIPLSLLLNVGVHQSKSSEKACLTGSGRLSFIVVVIISWLMIPGSYVLS